MLTRYLMDASSAIRFCKEHPADIYISVHLRMAALRSEERMLMHKLVLRELEQRDDFARNWTKSFPTDQTIDIDNDQGVFIRTLSRDYPQYAATFSQWEYKDSADPFLIACGKVRGLTVITEEGSKLAGIPFFCDKYSVA